LPNGNAARVAQSPYPSTLSVLHSSLTTLLSLSLSLSLDSATRVRQTSFSLIFNVAAASLSEPMFSSVASDVLATNSKVGEGGREEDGRHHVLSTDMIMRVLPQKK